MSPVRHWNATKELGDLTVSIGRAKHVPDRTQAFIDWLVSKLGSPDNSLPPGSPGAPDQGLPPTSPGSPDQGLPPTSGGGKPDQGLPGRPGAPGHPDNSLPSGGKPVDPGYGVDQGGKPDQGLPGDGGEAAQLPAFLKDHAKEIIKAIVKGTPCEHPEHHR